MDTMHLKDPLVLFGFEGSALSLPLFYLSHALPLFLNNGKGPLNEKNNFMALNGLLCRCAFKPIFIHSFIHNLQTNFDKCKKVEMGTSGFTWNVKIDFSV